MSASAPELRGHGDRSDEHTAAGDRLVGLDHPELAAATGRGVRVAVIDSGVHADHDHIHGIVGGVGIGVDRTPHGDYVDRLGHGTAVSAAILEKAPDVELLGVRVFDRSLSAPAPVLVEAIDWAAQRAVQLINLSLGTEKPEHEEILRDAVRRAGERGAVVVSAAESHGHVWLPGSLPETIGVRLDWECPRDALRLDAGSADIFASGYPRPIDGVPPERNLKGISFAVANVTGILARLLGARPGVDSAAVDSAVPPAGLVERLAELAST